MKALLSTVLQKALNRYLALDPESEKRLSALQGKVVQLDLLPFAWSLQLIFTANQINVQPDNCLQPDTIIKGTPINLLHLSLASQYRNRFFTDDVILEGSAEVGQQVIQLFDELEIDWEEYVSRLTGDVPAYHLGRLAKKFKNWTMSSRESLVQTVSEYVHEEVNLFPPREALEDFFLEIDDVRSDADRLGARILHLQNHLQFSRPYEGSEK